MSILSAQPFLPLWPITLKQLGLIIRIWKLSIYLYWHFEQRHFWVLILPKGIAGTLFAQLLLHHLRIYLKRLWPYSIWLGAYTLFRYQYFVPFLRLGLCFFLRENSDSGYSNSSLCFKSIFLNSRRYFIQIPGCTMFGINLQINLLPFLHFDLGYSFKQFKSGYIQLWTCMLFTGPWT